MLTPLFLFLTVAVAYWLLARLVLHGKTPKKNDETAGSSASEDCNGTCRTCLMECNLEKRLAPPEYYDDEELDAYAGRPAAAYTPEETEAFETVLTTMRPDEVAGWLTSLEQRGIALPDDLKDAAYLLVREAAERPHAGRTANGIQGQNAQ